MLNPEFGGQARMNFHARLRVVIDEGADSPGLGAREKLADDAPCRENDRVVRVDFFGRRRVVGGDEASLAVGEIEGTGAASHRVPGAWLKKTRGARVIHGLTVGRLAGTGPEDAVLILDLFISNARIVDHRPLGGDAQLLEHLSGVCEGHAVFATQRAGNILNDRPIPARLARALDRPVDLDNAPLKLRDRALVLLLQRPRQDDIGKTSGLVEEEVDRNVEVELLEHAPDEVVIGKRNHRVKANAQQALDLPTIDEAEDLVGIGAGLGQLLGSHVPEFGDMRAMLGIAKVAPSRKLVAFLAVLAPALAVSLPGDRAVAAVFAAQAAAGEHNVDRAKNVLHPVAMMLNAPSVHQKARIG